ncbi:MAG: EAL domain-containing protein [Steroidobacteraceae bacterium]
MPGSSRSTPEPARTSWCGERRDLESCFSECLLQLALQPLVEAGTGAVRGYEALLRSRHPNLDSPLRVIAAAEQHGLLGRLADRVGEAAAGWLAQLPAPLMLFINAHPDEMADVPAVQQRFAPLLDSASRLVIEITERSSALEQTDWRDAIVWLTEAGFRIAIDDLGSGYNSLAVLAELQPEFLKVDTSIVRHIDREERKQRLVELLTRFAQAADSRVVPEGIETEAEAATGHRLGVDLLQGYLFGRPSLTL